MSSSIKSDSNNTNNNNDSSTSDPKEAYGVIFVTNMGAFAIELYWLHAPIACENMSLLASRQYYDGNLIFRVISDYIIQTGDPTGTGRGGESAWGGSFADEITPELKHTGAGVVSCANAGPNTNKSQFFISLRPNPHLDSQNTIFGRIVAGMHTVRRLGMVPVDGNDRPKQEIRIISAYPYFTQEPNIREAAEGLVSGTSDVLKLKSVANSA